MYNKKKQVLFITIIMMLVSITIIPTTVLALNNKIETFEDDTTGGNPSSTWYTYTEGSGTGNTGVNTTTAYAGSKSFGIWENTNNGDKANAHFTLKNSFKTSLTDVEYTSFYLNMSNATALWGSNDNELNIQIKYIGMFFDITDNPNVKKGSRYNVTVDMYGFTNNKTLATNINCSTWTKYLIDYHWNNDTAKITLTRANATTDHVWMPINRSDIATAYGITNGEVEHYELNTYGETGDNVAAYLDNYKISFTRTGTQGTTYYITNTVLPLLLSVIIVAMLAGMALTGNLNKNSLIALMLFAIMGIITIQIILSL